MGLGAILCPDRIGQPAPPSFHPQNRLTGLMVIAHFNLHAEHNWSQTRAPERASVRRSSRANSRGTEITFGKFLLTAVSLGLRRRSACMLVPNIDPI